MKRRSIVIAGFATVLGLMYFGAAPRPARAEDDSLKVAVITVSAQGATFIAQERGYFKDEGLKVELQPLDDVTLTTSAVASGSSDISAGSFSAAIINLDAKGGLKIIAGLNDVRPGRQEAAIMATNAAWDSGLRTFRDLVGKRVGVSALGTANQLNIGLLAKKYGFSMSDVTVVPLQSLTNEVAAFRGNQIDALSAAQPIPGQLLDEKIGHLIGWIGDEVPYQAGVLYTRPQVIAEKPEALRKYIRALKRATQDYNTALNAVDAAGHPVKGPGYDEVVGIIAKYVHQPAEQLAKFGFPYADPSLELQLDSLQAQIDFWQSQKALSQPVTAAQITDSSFLK